MNLEMQKERFNLSKSGQLCKGNQRSRFCTNSHRSFVFVFGNFFCLKEEYTRGPNGKSAVVINGICFLASDQFRFLALVSLLDCIDYI